MNVKDNIRKRRQERLKQLVGKDKLLMPDMEYVQVQSAGGSFGVPRMANEGRQSGAQQNYGNSQSAGSSQKFDGSNYPEPPYSTDVSYNTARLNSTDHPHSTDYSYSTGHPHNADHLYSTDHPHNTDHLYSTDHPHSTDHSYSTDQPYSTARPHNTDVPYDIASTEPPQIVGAPQTIAAPQSVGGLIYPPSGIGALPPQMMNDPRYRDPEYVWKHRRELYPNLYDTPGYREEHTPRKPPTTRRRFMLGKLVLSTLLFALVWGLFQLDTTSPLALKAKQYVQSAMTDDFQFNSIAAWYEQHFQGAPSLIPAFGDKHNADDSRKVNAPAGVSFVSPVKGAVVGAFNAQSDGVTVQTAVAAPVKAAAAGVVVSVGIQDGRGLAVVVRHSGQYETTYGQLTSTQVNKNDWVAEGAVLGQASDNSAKTAGKLYFAVSRNGRYIDPADVVTFD